MKINNKINMKIGILVGIFLLLVSPVFAFGVGMPYMENKELYLYPGEIRDLGFSLQVEEGTEGSINAKAEIIEGSEIMKLTDSSDVYVVSFGQHTPVNFQVAIPDSAQIGDSYPVKLGFSAEAGAGSFAFGSVIEQNFDIVVGEKPAVVIEQKPEKQFNNVFFYLILVAVVLVVIVIFFIVKKRKK